MKIEISLSVRLAVLASLFLLAIIPCAQSVESDSITYGEGRELSGIDGKTVGESSGIAAGINNQDIFWTHNDSGGKPVVYAFNKDGVILGAYQVKGASAQDWEDIASVRIDKKGYLVVGDVGDNAAKRKDYSIYFFEEPVLKTGKKDEKKQEKVKSDKKKDDVSEGKTKEAKTLLFEYEDGPHNCEALGVDPETLKVYLVSKIQNAQECKVYELPSLNDVKKTKKLVTAKAVASIKVPTVTAMDISSDGSRAIICTYGNAYEYTRKNSETWKDAFSRDPRIITLPPRKQGEAICYGPDGKSIYLTSEAPNKGQDGDAPFLIVPVVEKKVDAQ